MRKTLLTLPVISALSLCSLSAYGAGFALIENSASGMGSSFAGAAALAEDGSTIYFNPAGMTELNDRGLTGALHWVRPVGSYSDSGSTAATGGSLSGGNSDNKSTDAIIPNLYYHKRLDDGVVFGLGINVPFGMETNYDDDWVGRYHGVQSKVMSININPSIAWEIDDNLSFGAGINGQYIHVILSSAVDFGGICSSFMPTANCNLIGLSPQQNDGFVELDADGFAWGYNFGLLLKPTQQTRIGLSHRSQITQNVSGTADFTVPGAALALTSTGSFTDTNISSTVTLPDSTSVSMVQELDKITLLFDWTYTRWSSFDELRIDYATTQPDSVTTENWVNSNRYALGINYQLSPVMVFRSGLAYDETSIPDSDHRTPRVPGNNRTWFSLGMGYQIDNQLSFDLGYAHLFVKDPGSSNTFESSASSIEHTLIGDYTAKVDIFSAQLNWSF